MTLEELKNELNYLSMRNHSIEKMLDLEKRNKRRYDFLISTNQLAEAQKVADQMQAWQKGKPLDGIADLEKKYIKAILQLPQLDRSIATLRFMQGKTYKQIAKELCYSPVTVKKRMYGQTVNSTSYPGIYDLIFYIMGEG